MGADRAETVQGLRDFADWLEANPQVPVPWRITGQDFLPIDEIREAMHLSGPWVKQFVGSYVEYSRDFGPNVTVEFNAAREQVCRKVQTGVRHVEARDEPVYEWQCSDLADGFAAHAQAGVEAIREASKPRRDYGHDVAAFNADHNRIGGCQMARTAGGDTTECDTHHAYVSHGVPIILRDAV